MKTEILKDKKLSRKFDDRDEAIEFASNHGTGGVALEVIELKKGDEGME